MIVRHSYIAGLHHYLIVNWDDDLGGWNVGISALPSKKIAKRYAGGYFDTKVEVAQTTNPVGAVRMAWFIHELQDVMNHLGRKYGMAYWYAIAVDDQRHRIYRWALSKKGWSESFITEDGLGLTKCMFIEHGVKSAAH